MSALAVPRPQVKLPQVVLSDEQRWDHVETLLHDTTIDLNVPVAGLFTLLFAQPLSRVCRMRAHQITTGPDLVTVTFDTSPIELPDPLDRLVRDHLTPPRLGLVRQPTRYLAVSRWNPGQAT